MQLSKFISVILHPIFMPIISLYLSLKLTPSIGFALTNYLNFIYLVLLFSTIILPLISILFLIKNKTVSSLEMSCYKERSVPLLITALWVWLGYYALEKILVFSPILRSELIGVIIIILLAAIISKYWKISLHMLAIGGVTGVLFSLNVLFGGLLYITSLFVLFAGVLGVARLNEKAHNHTQVYTGFLLGFLIETGSLLF